MRIIWGLVVAAILAIGVVGFGAVQPAQACSCAVGGTQEERDAAASTIFVGSVLSEELHPGPTDASAQAPGEYEFVVDVEQTIKGEVEDPASLWTAEQGATCGRRLTVGDRYRLYPTRSSDGRLRIGLCDGTQDLGKGSTAPPPTPTTTTSRAPPSTTASTTAAPTTTSSTPDPEPSTSTSTSLETPAAGDAAPPPTITIGDEGGGEDETLSPVLVAGGAAALAASAGAATLVSLRRRRSAP